MDKTTKTLYDPKVHKHPIRVASSYTGLSVDRIRAWEKRYGAVIPARDSNQRRWYSQEDIERLNLLKKATSIGRRIKEVENLSNQELTNMINRDAAAVTQLRDTQHTRPSTGSVMEYFDLCLDAVVDLNVPMFHSAFNQAADKLGPIFLLEDMLLPLINHIHEECRRGELQNVHESMFSETLRTMLVLMCITNAKDADNQNKAIIFSPESDIKMYALRGAVSAALSAWKPVYIGTDIGIAEIYEAVTVNNINTIIIGLSDIGNNIHSPNLISMLASLLKDDVNLFVNMPFNYPYTYAFSESRAIQTNNLSELNAHLNKLTKNNHRDNQAARSKAC